MKENWKYLDCFNFLTPNNNNNNDDYFVADVEKVLNDEKKFYFSHKKKLIKSLSSETKSILKIFRTDYEQICCLIQ